jgi:spore germination protein YaaH
MDWTALCDAADRLQVMLYNEHNGSTDPGPIAGLDWMLRVVAYGQSRCRPGKLVPVLKVSGMDWGPDRAEWRTFAEVSRVLAARGLKPRREWWNRSPWFVYRDVDGRHTVHYEDARSLAAKADRLRARGLATLVLWSLGSEDPETIPRLATAARPAEPQKR